VAATTKKKAPFRSWSRRGGQNISDHPGRALLTFDGASTPPLEEGNRSVLAIFTVGQQAPQPRSFLWMLIQKIRAPTKGARRVQALVVSNRHYRNNMRQAIQQSLYCSDQNA
jgi:hypothetical protein